MANKICFIYTDTNGIHDTIENVSTKNLYNYARVIAIHYSIGSYDKVYIEEKKCKIILKPDTINFNLSYIVKHNITSEIAEKEGIENSIAIQQFKTDIKNVNIIVSYDLSHHIRALQVECIRTANTIDFSKYILIDLKSFNQDNTSNNLNFLIKQYKITTTNILEQLKLVFFKLYEKISV